MVDEWLDFISSYVVAGKFETLPGTKFPLKPMTRGTMLLQFESGYVAVYRDTPYTIWLGMVEAESKGTYHWRAVRGRPYSQGGRE